MLSVLGGVLGNGAGCQFPDSPECVSPMLWTGEYLAFQEGAQIIPSGDIVRALMKLESPLSLGTIKLP